MRRTAALALGLLVATTACSGSSSSGAKPAAKPGAAVAIPLLSFTPDTVRVKVGQTVTWTNGNDIKHVLVEGTYQVDKSTGLRTSEKDDGTFSLTVNKKGDVVSHTYDKAGTFTYFCTIHKGMNATVVVS
jgi:plastocyanin